MDARLQSIIGIFLLLALIAILAWGCVGGWIKVKPPEEAIVELIYRSIVTAEELDALDGIDDMDLNSIAHVACVQVRKQLRLAEDGKIDGEEVDIRRLFVPIHALARTKKTRTISVIVENAFKFGLSMVTIPVPKRTQEWVDWMLVVVDGVLVKLGHI
jgi:hypothetical protein